MQWRSQLRHCATRLKLAESVPDVIEIFHSCNPSGRTMAPGLTQPLTEMSTRKFPEGKGSQCLTNHLHVPIVLKSGSLNLLEPSGPVQACNGMLYLYLMYTVGQGSLERISVLRSFSMFHGLIHSLDTVSFCVSTRFL
jgi:hypothetical protein